MQIEDIQAVVDHYTEASESTRLQSTAGRLEFERTMSLLKQHLPPPPCTVLDVGGASGVYSLALAAAGYQVHLIDPVPKHVDQAREASKQATHQLASAEQGDARRLPQLASSVDAVLLMGPLYHLLASEDRHAALLEAYRVLRPGGVLFAVAISKFASTLDGLCRNLLADPIFAEIVAEDLRTGCHRNPTGNPDYFTDAVFHLPEELEQEAARAGFTHRTVEAIEGPAWLLSNLSEWMNTESRHQQLMSLLDQISSQGCLTGVSAHFALVSRKVPPPPFCLQLKNSQIRNFAPADVESLVESANDKEVASFLRDGFPHPYTHHDATWWIAHARAGDPVTHFAIAVDGKAVGGVGLIRQEDVARKSAEIGYWLGRNYWGRGIATEVVNAFSTYVMNAFDLNRVYAMAFEGNTASTRVLEKAGFQFEGRLRKSVFKRGEFLDQLMYAIVRQSEGSPRSTP